MNIWKSDPPNRLAPEKIAASIQQLVCTQFFITREQIRGRSRAERIVIPRFMAMALTRRFTELTLQEVGALYGKRDHGTAKWAEERHQELLCSSMRYRENCDAVVNALQRQLRDPIT